MTRMSCKMTEAGMRNFIRRFVRNEIGATAIEYSLIAGGVAIVIVAAINSIGSSVNTKLGQVAPAINP